MASYNDISDMLLRGYTTREVAAELGISPSTVSVTAKNGGMVYENKMWSEPATGRIESSIAEKVASFFRDGLDVLKNIIMEPAPPEIPPSIPEPPRRIQTTDLGFGIRDLPKLFPRETGDGREHMDIVVQVTIKNKDGSLSDIVRNFKILQYTDEQHIRRTMLAKMKYINREAIVSMKVWINDDEEYYDWGQDDFIADSTDYPEAP